MSEITHVHHKWYNETMGITREMDMPVEIQLLDKLQTTYQGVSLQGFWMPNWYATGPEYYQCYLHPVALEDLELAQVACVEAGGSILIVDSYRSWDRQMEAYRSKPGIAVKPEQSNHTKGLAIDARAHTISQDEMAEILADYEWIRTVPHEPWHFDYRGAL